MATDPNTAKSGPTRAGATLGSSIKVSLTKPPFERILSSFGDSQDLEEIISTRFRIHDKCRSFVADINKPTICMCGRKMDTHEDLSGKITTWSLKDCCTSEPTSFFGTVKFSKGPAAQPRWAPYIRMSSTSNPELAVDVVKELYKRRFPNYHKPNLVISITGGARAFELNKRLLEGIRNGLRHAASSTDAWIITGGSNSGVMQLVGDIMSADHQTPVIGIMSYGVVKNRHMLGGVGRRSLAQRTKIDYNFPDYNFASLDRNHNLFLLVDDGREGHFGGEIEFRTAFESATSRLNDLPIVTMVIQGGPGTLDTALNAIRNDTPLVVVEGSGQTADLIAYAWNFLHGESTRARSYTSSELRFQVRQTFPHIKTDKLLEKIYECVASKEKVIIYNMEDSGYDLDAAILEAVFQGGTSINLRFKLKQAMLWGRLDIAKRALLNMGKHDEGELNDILSDNLMWALRHNNPDFVELYLANGANVSKLRPSSAKVREADGPRRKSARWDHISSFQAAMEELYEDAASNPHGHVFHLLHPRKALKRGDLYSLDRVHRVVERLVSSDFRLEYAMELIDDESVPIDAKETMAYHMLLIWAVCCNKFRLANLFWRRGDQSIPNALVASRMLDAMARHSPLQVSHLSDAREKMAHNAKKFEALAVGVLEECQHADTGKVAMMLHAPIPRFRSKNCIEVAYDAKNLSFLSHPATQAVVNTDWYCGRSGKVGMSPGTAWYQVVLSICLLFPWTIKFNNREEEGALPTEDSMHSTDLFAFRDNRSSKPLRPSLLQKWKAFFQAPVTRFFSDAIAFLTLLLLFSYMVLSNLGDSISNLEAVVCIWIASMGLEELRQFSQHPAEWVTDAWNWLDANIVFFYFVGFMTRLSDPASSSINVRVKAVYGFVCLILWLRLARYYTVSETLGPKLIMMRRMTSDVIAFIALLAIFLIGYGVVAQVFLFPDRPFDYQTFENIFYRPYFQTYGELFLEEIQEETDCVGPWQFSSCGMFSGGSLGFLVPVLLGIYLMVANILLINLLIAMFNQTYIEVEEQSRKYWNMQNFELYQEYKSRPMLPPPLIILSLVGRFVYDLFEMVRGRSGCGHFQHLFQNARHRPLDPETRHRLETFQELHTDKFVNKSNAEQQSTDSARIEQNGEAITRLHEALNKLDSQQTAMQSMLERSSDPMHNGGKDQHPESGFDRTLTEQAQAYQPPTVYPDGTAMRAEVPLALMPWGVPFPDYSPTIYTASQVSGAVWADPDDWRAVQDQINKSDGKINRVSFLGDVNFDEDGRPLNPKGRTGMVGRGLLGKWGTNHAADPIVTRWKRSKDNSIMERDGHKVLEFVCVRRRDNHQWAIPGGFIDNGESLSLAMRKEFMEEALNVAEAGDRDVEKINTLIDDLFQDGIEICRDYSNDPRNTDNAWIETTAINFHDATGLGAGKFALSGGDDASAARWVMIHRDLNLYASHKLFIREVARLHDAYW